MASQQLPRRCGLSHTSDVDPAAGALVVSVDSTPELKPLCQLWVLVNGSTLFVCCSFRQHDGQLVELLVTVEFKFISVYVKDCGGACHNFIRRRT